MTASAAAGPPDQPAPPGTFSLNVKSIADGPDGKKIASPHPVRCHCKTTIGELKYRLSQQCGIPYEEVWLLLQNGDTTSSNRGCVFLKEEARTLEDYGVGAESAVWCFRRAPRGPLSAGEDDSVWSGVAASLQSHGLAYHRSGGDGNCLFRSVSMLVYGDEAHHGVVRSACMDYMVTQSHAFEPVVAGDFQQYVLAKRKQDGSSASWGDEPELLAMSELYHRNVQVWTFFEDQQTGALEPRLFSEYEPAVAQSCSAPIRVCFLGKGHYDALVPNSTDQTNSGLLVTPPGEYEAAIIEKTSHRTAEEEARIASARAAFRGAGHAPLEQEILDKVRTESLLVLRRQASTEMAGALAESMADEIHEIQVKFEDEATRAAMQASQEEAESTQMKAVEQQQLAEALDKSRRAQLVADLEAMGVPGYEAEYAAENAKDVESALEFLNNAKNAGEQGSEAAKQLIALSGMPDMPVEQAQYYLDAAGGSLDLAFTLMSNPEGGAW